MAKYEQTAIIEHNQALWDWLLLECWHRDLSCDVLLRHYKAHLGIPQWAGLDFDDMREKLKRFPTALKGPVRARISDNFPWLSTQLWDGPRSDEELIKMMTDAGYDVERSRVYRAEKSAAQHQAKRLQASRIATAYDTVRYKEQSRSNWGVCKRTKNR